MKTSESCDKIYPALIAAQAEMENALKKSENPYFKSHYADLSEVLSVAKPALHHHGLAVLQSPSTVDGRVIITTRICHESGQWIESELSLTPLKTDPQSIGSAITYGRRYSLSSLLGIAQEDDDGNAAATAPTQKVKKEREDLLTQADKTYVDLTSKNLVTPPIAAWYKTIEKISVTQLEAGLKKMREIGEKK